MRAATIVSEELDDIRDDVVEDLSSSFVDGSFDETLAKSDSSALANATVAVDESTRLVEEETTVNLVPQRTDAPTPSPLQPSSSGGSSKSGSSGSQILIIILCFIVFLCLCVVLVIVLIVRGRRRSQLVESSGASEEEVRRYLEQHGSFVETNKESVVKAHPSTPMKEARIETIAPSIYAEEGKQETGSEVFHKSVSFNDTPLSSDYVGVSCADTPPEEEVSSEEEDEAGEDPRRSGARRRLY